MWIIPKNSPIFPSAQATEALISDLKELSDMCEQSVMWRSKTSSSTTWLRRLKRTSSTTVLSSQTLKYSPGNSLVAEWTSSLGASLANHFQQQEEEKEVKTQDTCGPISQMESNAWVDLPLFSSKMSRESSVPNSKERTGQIQREHQFCYMSSENWKGWVTRQRQAYSQRVKSAHHTSESESLYLVSEMTSQRQALVSSMNSLSLMNQTEIQHGQLQEDKDSIGTSHQELRWATPIAGSGGRTGGGIEYYILSPNVGKQVDLNGQVMLQNWTTPIARDCYEIEMNQQIPNRKDGKSRMDTMPRQIHHQENYRGKLNPRWVEMLMGLPIGWTMPSCTNPVTTEQMSLECLGMELCPIQPQEHSESFGENWSTPPSSQRGETLYHYLNRMESRRKRGYKDFFAPTLQIQVEAAELGIDIKHELNKIKDKHSQNWPTPNARDYKDTLNTVPPSINQTRGYSLGQALAEELNKKQNE